MVVNVILRCICGILEVYDTMAILGICDPNVGNPYSTRQQRLSADKLREMLHISSSESLKGCVLLA